MNKEEKINIIKNEILNYYNISLEEFESVSRKAEIVQARHIVLYMIRYELGLTFREIAKILNKETSTIIRNFQSISDRSYTDKLLQRELHELKINIRKSLENNV